MPIDAGLLRHRVTIQDFQSLLDTDGDVIQDPNTGNVPKEWVTVAEVWAAIEPMSAREFVAAQAQMSKVTTRITIRRNAAVSAGMRLLHNGMIYNIEGVLADKDSGLEYQTLPCSQGVRRDTQ